MVRVVVDPRNTVYPGWDGVHHKVQCTPRRFLSIKSDYWQVYGRRTSGDPNMWSNQRSGLNQGPLSHEVAMLPVTPLYNHWNVLLIYWNPRHLFFKFKFLSFLPAEVDLKYSILSYWGSDSRDQAIKNMVTAVTVFLGSDFPTSCLTLLEISILFLNLLLVWYQEYLSPRNMPVVYLKVRNLTFKKQVFFFFFRFS